MNMLRLIVPALAMYVSVTSAALARAQDAIRLDSLSREVQLEILVAGDHLSFAVRRSGAPVIEPSPLGLTVDGLDLARGVELGAAEIAQFDERYPTRGVHSTAINHGKSLRVPVRHRESGTRYHLEARAFDDGVALRLVVPGDGHRRVPDEVTAFRLPEGCTAWPHDLRGHYEGIPAKKSVADIRSGEWCAVPLTFKLPNSGGYASITEAVLGGFPGMALQAKGDRTFAARLGHSHPPSSPFMRRYAADADRLAKPASLEGTLTAPWRVVMVGPDLNTLVNCDIVSNLAPPPDLALFPEGLATAWIKPGRAVWRYLDGGQSSRDGIKECSRLAGALGFEYQVVEGVWQRWSDAELRDVVKDAKAHGVGIWLWKHSKDLRTSEERRAFFQKCADAGAVGAKIDFFDHEAKEVVDLYAILLREAAEHHVLVDFHGANKPTGEPRTWPNELGREGVYGLEHRSTTDWSVLNTTLPFTRFLAGHADYTPMHFGERRHETSWAHQIATAAVMPAPLLVYAANPKNILANPAVELIKSLPSVWDETIVLPISEIGQRAAVARRTGDRWFLAIVNGPAGGTVRIPAFFLGAGEYRALLVRDRTDDPAAVNVEEVTVTNHDPLEIELRPRGGFVARFTKP
jgi:alpha-glucosidase